MAAPAHPLIPVTRPALDQPMEPGARMHPLTLRFDDSVLERAFLDGYHASVLGVSRAALAVGLLLYAVFGALDRIVVPHQVLPIWVIRFAVVCPFAALCLALTFTPRFRRRLDVLLGAMTVVGGLGIIAMTLIADPPGSYLYYAGLLLVMMYGYTFTRLRFLPALIACGIVTVAYEVAAVTVEQTPFAILVNNSFFLLSANVIGMIACYQLEWHARREFLLRRSLEQSAIRDPLTGLFNRRYLDSQLDEMVGLYQRYRTPFTAMLLDVDNFNAINDTHGHLAGDAVLKAVARTLKANVRETDLVFRFGGDEFEVLLPSTKAKGMRFLADRLLAALNATRIEGVDGALDIGFSAGASEMAAELPGAEPLLERASRALLEAKKQGKGRLVCI
ncbi:MAG TPA: GGDEF domain-containing protein [Ardenticatenaceae bacterium]|nr:GGDEF domain-containing protein [Ardenticatenaceae bacterium]